MTTENDALELTEDQVLYFRARRSHLAGSGAASATEAARDILGAQSQQIPPGLMALSLRTAGRPTAEAVKSELFDSRSLVRFWGQRDTIHIYDPEDWAVVIAGLDAWQHGGRRGVMPSSELVDEALHRLEAVGEPVTRKDLFDMVPAGFLKEAEEKMGPGPAALRLAAGRLLWSLALRGDACAGGKIGAETTYVARSHWFPDLPWPDPPPSPHAAAVTLARRYLAVNGPATAADVAHFFNAKVTNARIWLEEIRESEGLIEVQCRLREGGDRKGLVALAKDEQDLKAPAPSGFRDWPLRLLPLWDTLLMSHKDKSWTVPNEDDRKRIWRKAAFVSAVVVARGRIVANWAYKAKKRVLEVEVEPLSRWRASQHASGVRREAQEVAAHLGLPEAKVTIS